MNTRNLILIEILVNGKRPLASIPPPKKIGWQYVLTVGKLCNVFFKAQG